MKYRFWQRALEFITFTHRVHHVNFGYGWVFLPLSIGYFPEFREAFKHVKGGARAWRVVTFKRWHNCTISGVY